jgi:uncharacterized membrane protein YkgB
MRAKDEIIKKTLKSNIQQIDDNYFTKRIVENHLVKNQIVKHRPFINFFSLIIGLSAVIISIGLVLLIKQNNDWIREIGLTENHGLIILTLSFIFLIYKWIEEFTAPNTQFT